MKTFVRLLVDLHLCFIQFICG